VFKEIHETNFQEKLTGFGGLDIQTSKKSIAKGKGKKIIPQEIVELLEDVTMVNNEVMTLKMDFDDLLEGIDKRRSSRRLDLSPKSYQPPSSWLISLLEV
jgi:hypothetical protein